MKIDVTRTDSNGYILTEKEDIVIHPKTLRPHKKGMDGWYYPLEVTN